MSAASTGHYFMKKYAAIHVGTRWTADHTWGVMVEGGKPAAELLCVGCTQKQAEEMAKRLNEGAPRERLAV